MGRGEVRLYEPLNKRIFQLYRDIKKNRKSQHIVTPSLVTLTRMCTNVDETKASYFRTS